MYFPSSSARRGSRTTTPPVIEQRVSPCGYCHTGGVIVAVLQVAGSVTVSGTVVPSVQGQPKFAPSFERGSSLISSRAPSPTSPIIIVSSFGSIQNRQGFRRP